VLEGAGPLARKKYEYFCPLSDKFGCILLVFNRQKTRTVIRSLGTRILRFNGETKLTKNSTKIIQKFTVIPKVGRAIASPQYATVCWSQALRRNSFTVVSHVGHFLPRDAYA